MTMKQKNGQTNGVQMSAESPYGKNNLSENRTKKPKPRNKCDLGPNFVG